jgi:signal transduction histidine kinase
VLEAAEAHLPDGLSLKLTAPDGLPPVEADPMQLRQVLDNLLDNAIKYSPDGGQLELELEHLDGRVRFAVRDEGLGIPPREQQRIFEKFYRLDPNMTRGIGGTGLGLYICRELVRRLRGRIWVDSAVGKGSTFFVELPVAKPAKERRRAKKPVKQPS